MNPAGIPLRSRPFPAAASDAEQVERALIDASTRVPVLIFYTSAMAGCCSARCSPASFRSNCTRRICLSNISFLDLGSRAPGAHERDGVRLGVDGRHGNGDLADGAAVPDDAASSAAARCGRRILESRCAAWRGRNFPWRKHGLSMAGVSALCGNRSFRRLLLWSFPGRC